MKNLLLTSLLFLFSALSIHAQNPALTGGNVFLEANGRLGSSFGEYSTVPMTGFSLISIDETTIWSVGFEGGYFIQDQFAVKAGLGYLDFDGQSSSFSYKVGARYYAASQIPLQVDVSGATMQDRTENPLWLGLQGGYAIFLTERISLEPSLRYMISLNEEFSGDNIFEARFGFVLYFIKD